jgi:hypothetical protein
MTQEKYAAIAGVLVLAALFVTVLGLASENVPLFLGGLVGIVASALAAIVLGD